MRTALDRWLEGLKRLLLLGASEIGDVAFTFTMSGAVAALLLVFGYLAPVLRAQRGT